MLERDASGSLLAGRMILRRTRYPKMPNQTNLGGIRRGLAFLITWIQRINAIRMVRAICK
jgi:hypothetical protein